MKGIDLIHDTRHLFPRSKIDGIKIVSRGISGGKQGLKFAYTSNQSQFCSLFQNKNTILVLQNVWFEFPQVLRHYCLLSGHLRSLLLQKKLTMITSSHNLPLSSLRFFVVLIEQTRPRILQLANFISCLSHEKPRDIAFIPSVLTREQRWRIWWIRSIFYISAQEFA